MKIVAYLIFCLCLTACSHWPFQFFSKDGSGKQNPELFKEPRIYIGQQDKWIPISELNREPVTLSLSDQILFSNQTPDEPPPQKDLKALEHFNPGTSSLKTTVYSSCFYKETDKSVWEVGSESYLLSFSILELIPNEILTGPLDDVFYCSFIFAFKNPEGHITHYNITLQSIDPSLGLRNNQGKIALFIETENQSIPMGNENVIGEDNAHNVTLINTTDIAIHTYHLSCEGLKIQNFPGTSLNRVSLYGNFVKWDQVRLQEGIKKCRVFAKNKQNNVIGMTDAFHLDFDGLNKALLKSPPPAPQLFKEPKIYISQQDKWIPISELNKGSWVLSLSDKISFSDTPHQELTLQKGLEDLESLNLEEPSSLKITVHSSCSDKEENTKFERKTGSESYLLSLSILEVLPKGIFMDKLDTVFSCSFLFSLKNPEGTMNDYNILQQSIDPTLNYNHNQLSLMTKDAAQKPINISNTTLEANDILNAAIVNTTNTIVDSYHLFCEGQEVQMFSGASLNTIPLYGNLIKWDQENPQKGTKKCRVFAKNEKRHIISMTNPFSLDFDSLNKHILQAQTQTIDFQTVQIHLFKTNDIKSKINPGSSASLNSHFAFKSIDALNDYSNSIEIQVTTECTNNRLFGTETVTNNSYHFPFHETFPVMAVTPKAIFLMGDRNYNDWIRKRANFLNKQRTPRFQSFPLTDRTQEHYISSCVYEVTLANTNNENNKKKFKKQRYFIRWSPKSYGVDYKPLASYEFITPFADYTDIPMNIRKTFLRLTDVKANRAGNLQLNFFDIIQGPFVISKDHKIDSVVLECHCHMINKESNVPRPRISPLEVNWPYSDVTSNFFIPLKTLLSHPTTQQYFKENALAVCRVLLYEKELLRYFSGEMKITQ